MFIRTRVTLKLSMPETDARQWLDSISPPVFNASGDSQPVRYSILEGCAVAYRRLFLAQPFARKGMDLADNFTNREQTPSLQG